MKSRRLGLLGVLVALMAIAPLGMRLASAQDATVSVELNEWNVIPDAASVSAGDIEFVATNTGAIVHEFVIFKTDLPPDALPVVDQKVNRFAEGLEDVGVIRADDLPPGATASDTFTLASGNYALICNIPGHYEAGMYVAFTVTDGAAAAVAAPATGIAGPLSERGDGFPSGALIMLLASLGAFMLAAGGGWSLLRSRRLGS